MKLALIGSGRIVEDALYAMAPVTAIEKTAIFARPHSEAKGRALAQQYGIAQVFTDYDALLREADADTVYIGLVNCAHYEYAKRALEAGKNVIMEKAFTGYAAQAEELAALARAKGLMLLEAITPLHSSVFEKMRESVGKLGQVRAVYANFAQYSSRYDDYLQGKVNPAFDRKQMGGCLFDIIVYCVHCVTGLFGEPKDVKYYANIGFNGTDTSGCVVMVYDGFTCVCGGAKDSDGLSYVSVQGEKGTMLAEGKPNMLTRVTITNVESGVEAQRDANGATVRNIRTEMLAEPAAHHRMTREFTDFARIIDTGDRETADALLSESVAVMRVLEKARLSAGIAFEDQ